MTEKSPFICTIIYHLSFLSYLKEMKSHNILLLSSETSRRIREKYVNGDCEHMNVSQWNVFRLLKLEVNFIRIFLEIIGDPKVLQL